LWLQIGKLVQWRLVSASLVTVYTTRTPLVGAAEMSISASPRLFATSFINLDGLITATFVDPPVGASLFTYLAIVDLLTSHPGPCGARKTPLALSYETSSSALIKEVSMPLPFVTPESFATKTAFAFVVATTLSMMTSFLPTIGMSAALATPAASSAPHTIRSPAGLFI